MHRTRCGAGSAVSQRWGFINWTSVMVLVVRPWVGGGILAHEKLRL